MAADFLPPLQHNQEYVIRIRARQISPLDTTGSGGSVFVLLWVLLIFFLLLFFSRKEEDVNPKKPQNTEGVSKRF